MPKASFGVNASAPEPTGVRATLPISNSQQDDYISQGSSDEETPGQGRGLRKGKGAAQISPVGKSAPSGEGRIMQGSSSIKQPPQVTAEDIDIDDDLDVIFEGSDFSEDFKNKAKYILESAVAATVNEHLERISEELEEQFIAEREELVEEFSDKLDAYLNYVVEEWVKENRLALETGIRSEIAESFLSGLRDLFEEHYVDVPESEVDVAEELADRVRTLEEDVDSLTHDNVSLSEKVRHYERMLVLAEASEDLTDTQAAKLQSLAEASDFTDINEFRDHVELIRESYFGNSDDDDADEYYDDEEDFDSEEITSLNEGDEYIDPSVRKYVGALSKIAPRSAKS